MNHESKERLFRAYKSDLYIQDIQRRISKFMEYCATPFNNEVPDTVKLYQQMIKMYTEQNYPFLLPETKTYTSDLGMAMGWMMLAQNEQRILSTKEKSRFTVLENIDLRLTLYHRYQKFWINNTNWEFLSPMDIFIKLGFMIYREPVMSFDEWLYTHGYEFLLTDREFLNVIADLDKRN